VQKSAHEKSGRRSVDLEWFALIGHPEVATYTLILLMTAGAAIIGFCVTFEFFMREWNDIGSRNAAPSATRRAESE
jgi:hypothetical protein